MNDLPNLLIVEPAEIRRNGPSGVRPLHEGSDIRVHVAEKRMPEARTSAGRCGSCTRGMAQAASLEGRDVVGEIRRRSAKEWELTC